MKQLSSGRHVAPLRHIIMIPTTPVFALTPVSWALRGKATNTNVIVFELTNQPTSVQIYDLTHSRQARTLVHIYAVPGLNALLVAT